MDEEDIRRRQRLGGRRGAIKRHGGDPAELAEIEREINAGRVIARVRRLLAGAPKMTPAELNELSEIVLELHVKHQSPQ
jgi:hypothetical protein